MSEYRCSACDRSQWRWPASALKCHFCDFGGLLMRLVGAEKKGTQP